MKWLAAALLLISSAAHAVPLSGAVGGGLDNINIVDESAEEPTLTGTESSRLSYPSHTKTGYSFYRLSETAITAPSHILSAATVMWHEYGGVSFGGNWQQYQCRVADMISGACGPTPVADGNYVAVIDAANATDCAVGGGTTRNLCLRASGSWGDAGGSQNILKTTATGHHISSVNQSRNQTVTLNSTTVGAGQGDLIGTNFDVFAVGGNSSSGDEGAIIHRAYIKDWGFHPEVETDSSIAPGSPNLTLKFGSVTYWSHVGSDRLVVFTDDDHDAGPDDVLLDQRAGVVWCTAAATPHAECTAANRWLVPTSASTVSNLGNKCFALDATAFTTETTPPRTEYHWLKIQHVGAQCGGTACTANREFMTTWVAQNFEQYVPPIEYTPGSNSIPTGAGRFAPCEEIERVHYDPDNPDAGYVALKTPVRNTISTGASVVIPPYGTKQMQGFYINFDSQLGHYQGNYDGLTLYNLATYSGQSRSFDSGIRITGQCANTGFGYCWQYGERFVTSVDTAVRWDLISNDSKGFNAEDQEYLFVAYGGDDWTDGRPVPLIRMGDDEATVHRSTLLFDAKTKQYMVGRGNVSTGGVGNQVMSRQHTAIFPTGEVIDTANRLLFKVPAGISAGDSTGASFIKINRLSCVVEAIGSGTANKTVDIRLYYSEEIGGSGPVKDTLLGAGVLTCDDNGASVTMDASAGFVSESGSLNRYIGVEFSGKGVEPFSRLIVDVEYVLCANKACDAS